MIIKQDENQRLPPPPLGFPQSARTKCDKKKWNKTRENNVKGKIVFCVDMVQ